MNDYNIAKYSNDIEALQKLSNSNDYIMRACVAYNKHCPKSILEKLILDEISSVRQYAIVNINTTYDMLFYAFLNEKISYNLKIIKRLIKERQNGKSANLDKSSNNY